MNESGKLPSNAIKSSGQMKGQCHCGAIVIAIPFQPKTVTVCNCSICRRYMAVWGYYQREEIQLKLKPGMVNAYRQGDQMIDFISCRKCACVTHYEDIEKTPNSRLAVNFRMFAPSVWQHLKIRYFDGADSFSEVSRTQFLSHSKEI